MRKRTLLIGCASLTSVCGLTAVLAQPAGGAGLAVDVALGNEAPDQVLAILRDVGARNVQQIEQRGLGGVETVVAAIILAKGLGNLVVRLLPVWNCGLVLDARAERILTEKNCDLPKGTVLVISADGKRAAMQQPSAAQVESLVGSVAVPK
jgi:hypothetical protein